MVMWMARMAVRFARWLDPFVIDRAERNPPLVKATAGLVTVDAGRGYRWDLAPAGAFCMGQLITRAAYKADALEKKWEATRGK